MRQTEAESEPPRNLLRSSVGSGSISLGCKESHILPRECIICQKTQYKRERVSKKTIKEKLSQCETLSAGCLIDAAIRKADEVSRLL